MNRKASEHVENASRKLYVRSKKFGRMMGKFTKKTYVFVATVSAILVFGTIYSIIGFGSGFKKKVV